MLNDISSIQIQKEAIDEIDTFYEKLLISDKYSKEGENSDYLKLLKTSKISIKRTLYEDKESKLVKLVENKLIEINFHTINLFYIYLKVTEPGVTKDENISILINLIDSGFFISAVNYGTYNNMKERKLVPMFNILLNTENKELLTIGNKHINTIRTAKCLKGKSELSCNYDRVMVKVYPYL